MNFRIFLFVFLLLTIIFSKRITDENTYSTIIKNKKYNHGFLKSQTQKVPEQLKLDMNYYEDGFLRIKISDPNEREFEVPDEVLNLSQKKTKKIEDISSIGVKFNNAHNKLDFSLFNTKTNQTVFSFLPNLLTYSPYYLSYSYELTDDVIFGYGERIHEFKLNQGMYTLWLNDTGTPYDDGKGGKNLYGHHPLIINGCTDGSFIGVLFNNINAQDLVVGAPSKEGKVILEQRTIGGVIDLIFLRGDSPGEVIQAYHKLVGFAIVPPFWSLGWHQCRWGYDNADKLNEVVMNYNKYELPLDTIWSDIDYMQNYRDFTIDSKNFAKLPDFVKEWNKDNLHWVPIIDLGVAKIDDGSYPFYELGNKLDTYIRSNYTKLPLENNVWPGLCTFPDFSHPNATQFWEAGLTELHNMAPFSGIWHDMNEPGLFILGEKDKPDDSSRNKYHDIPYFPGNGRINLEGHSVSLNALVYGNKDPELSTMYNYKSFGPFKQNQIASFYFQKQNIRPFILSRASMFGMGRYASHWLGDNYASWDSMKYSITGVFNYQIFGFNLVGSDICGFGGNTNDNLCARWTILGSFYPFSRNHNDNVSIPQEPYSLGPRTLEANKVGLFYRYSLLRFIYTQMFLNSLRGANLYFKPTFFEFYQDKKSFDYSDRQIMLGSTFLFCPALDESENDYKAYFPNANWNVFPSGESYIEFNPKAKEGQLKSLNGRYGLVNLFMKGGSVVPYQNARENKILRSKNLNQIPTTIYINPDENNYAYGNIVFDDGISMDTIKNSWYTKTNVEMKNKMVSFTHEGILVRRYYENDGVVEKIVLFRSVGVDLSRIRLNKKSELVKISPTYDEGKQILTIVLSEKVSLDELFYLDLR